MPMLDLTGQKHGNLTVIRHIRDNRWLCRCVCGKEVLVHGDTLRRHMMTRCSRGCTAPPPVLTHEEAIAKAKAALTSAISRCTRPSNRGYADYGGRGIKVCDQWQGTNGVEQFIADVGLPTTADLTLDRIDVNGDYAPGNCRWITQKEQMRNTRKTRTLTFNDKTQSIAAWAEEVGIDAQLIGNRLKRGWTVKQALTIPVENHDATHLTRNSWQAMISRCTNPRNKDYAHYGGRGIKVCQQWTGADGFAQFLADMGSRPARCTLDRINGNGNYEPGNCRWASPHQQAVNRCTSTLITFRGVSRCQADWARLLGVTQSKLSARTRAGFPVERVLYPGALRGLSQAMLQLVDTGAPVAMALGVATAEDQQVMTALTALQCPPPRQRGLDLAGQVFGRLTVLHRVVNHGRRTAWLCRCACGREVEVQTGNLTSGNSTSCGCTHVGQRKPPRDKLTYESWLAMISRCTCTGNADYARYGGRGVKVCDRWTGEDGYAHFLADMGKRPVKMTLDRVDVNGDYTPSNCRWATVKEQAVNRSSTVFIAFAGRVLTERQWAQLLELDERAVNTRLRRGLPVAMALSADLHKARNVPLDKVTAVVEAAVANAVAEQGELPQLGGVVDMMAAEHPQAFIAWRAAMKHRPSGLNFHEFLRVVGPMPAGARLTVDDNGPLTVDNCHWSTVSKRGKLRYINFAGQRLTLTKWAEIIGVNKSTLHVRLESMPVVHALRPGDVSEKATTEEVAKAVYARLTTAWYAVVKEDLSGVNAPVVAHGGRQKLDLTGQVFGKLTVLGPGEPQVAPSGQRRSTMRCRCVCGNEVTVLTSNLRRGNTTSCRRCRTALR